MDTPWNAAKDPETGSDRSLRDTTVQKSDAAIPSVVPGVPTPIPDSAAAAPQYPGRGDVVDRYVLLHTLGFGGMGVVHAAYDPELDRKVALKLLRPGLTRSAGSDDARARLIREAQALAKLSHPNVVTVFDVGRLGAQVWLAMEYVEGKTLAAWLAEDEPSVSEIVAVLRDAGVGLRAAHDAGLLHRDFKPENVMLAKDGRVLVMDFGLARSGSGPDAAEDGVKALEAEGLRRGMGALSVDLTVAGTLVGTPAYMAPEQFSGPEVDERADQFSFCVTLYEAVYGKRPFGGDTVSQLEEALSADPERQAPPGVKVPRWLAEVLETGLQFDPDRRFPNMTALLAALDRGQRSARRVWTAGALVAAAVFVLGAAAADHLLHEQSVDQCREAASDLSGVWPGPGGAVRDQAEATLRSTGVSYVEETIDRVTPKLDKFVADWTEVRTRACLETTVEAARSVESRAKVDLCLEEQALRLERTVAQFEDADERTVASAASRASTLPKPAECIDPKFLAARPHVPFWLQGKVVELRRRMSAAGGTKTKEGYETAMAVHQRVRAEAEALGLRDISIRARRSAASALGHLEGVDASIPELEQVYLEAAEAGLSDVAASVAVTLAGFTATRQKKPEVARVWDMAAQVAALQTPDPESYESTRLNNLVMIHVRKEEYEEAIEISHALREMRIAAFGPEHYGMVVTLVNLGDLYVVTDRPAEGIPYLEEGLRIDELLNGSHSPSISGSLYDLAAAYRAAGRVDDAVAAYERVIEVDKLATRRSYERLSQARLAEIAAERGDAEAAIAHSQASLEISEVAYEEGTSPLVKAMGWTAHYLVEGNRLKEAEALASRAIEQWTASDEQKRSAKAVVRSRFVLARVLGDSENPAERSRALEEARAARDALGETKDEDLVALRDRIDAWLEGRLADPAPVD